MKPYNSLEEFKTAVRLWVNNDNPSKNYQLDDDLWDDFCDVLNEDNGQIWEDFAANKYSKLIDKEVEATWQRKRNRLAKVLL